MDNAGFQRPEVQILAEIVALRDVGKPRYFAEERRGQSVFQRRQIFGVALARRLYVIGDRTPPAVVRLRIPPER